MYLNHHQHSNHYRQLKLLLPKLTKYLNLLHLLLHNNLMRFLQ